MKKLKLDLGDLKVESFETNSRNGSKGTINGHGGTFVYTEVFDQNGCIGLGTCDAHTCDQGCTDITSTSSCPPCNVTIKDATCPATCAC